MHACKGGLAWSCAATQRCIHGEPSTRNANSANSISSTQLHKALNLNTLPRSGAALTDEDAERLCAALQRSGILLRHHNLVYLQAGDIAEVVMMVGWEELI